MGIRSLEYFTDIETRIKLFCCNYPYVFLYGAGEYGGLMYWLLTVKFGIFPKAYCVSEKGDIVRSELPVLEIQDFGYPLEQCGFVLSMKEEFQIEVIQQYSEDNSAVHMLQIGNEFFQYIRQLRDLNQIDLFTDIEYRKLETMVSDNVCVVIKRSAAMGDILCATPIAVKFKNMGYSVVFMTQYTDVLIYNSDIDFVIQGDILPKFILDKAHIIDLDDVYEKKPLMHVLDAYVEEVRRSFSTFVLEKNERMPVYDRELICAEHNNIGRKKLCVNNEGSWPTRTYERKKMIRFITYLSESGYTIFEIGKDEKNYLGIGKNCYGLALHDTVKLMSEMDLYIGMDGGLMHFAQAIRLPMFIIFGCICPNFRIHDWRIAKVMWKNTNELACAGCHHRRKSPRKRTECDQKKIYCLEWSVEEVIKTFEKGKFNQIPVLHDDIYRPL